MDRYVNVPGHLVRPPPEASRAFVPALAAARRGAAGGGLVRVPRRPLAGPRRRDAAALLDYADLATLGVDFEAGHYLGRLDDLDCYALQLDDALELPAETAFEGLRALYGRLPDDVLRHRRSRRPDPAVGSDASLLRSLRAADGATRRPNAPSCARSAACSVFRGSARRSSCSSSAATSFCWRATRPSPTAFSACWPASSSQASRSRRPSRARCSEEVGLEVTDIRYFGSQPWPFPHSLMIGFTATYASGEIRLQEDEIAEAAWFSRTRRAAQPARQAEHRPPADRLVPRLRTIARERDAGSTDSRGGLKPLR